MAKEEVRDWFERQGRRLTANWYNVVLSALALGLAYYSVFQVPVKWEKDDFTKAIWLGLWVIGIPIFFFVEWYLNTDPSLTDPESKEFKLYEKSRDSGQKVWLAIASFLTLLYFGSHLKNPAQEKVKELETKVQNLENKIKELGAP